MNDGAYTESKPLAGLRILVTRAKSQANELMEALEAEGAVPVAIPLIKIVPPKSYRAIDNAIRRLPEDYDWLIFTSANAVRFFAERLRRAGKDVSALAGVRVAAIGPATAKVLEGLSIDLDYLPEDSMAESVVKGFEEMGIDGERFLMPRAEVAREIIPERLAQLGAVVDVVDAYRTVLDESAGEEMRRLFEEREIDVVTFTSSSTAKNFVAVIDGDFKRLLEGVLVAVIGPVTAETAEKLGLDVEVVACEFNASGLVKALVKRAKRVAGKAAECDDRPQPA